MRLIWIIMGLAAMSSCPVLAQPAGSQDPNPKPSTEKPIDNGPVTPGANNAFQGGGVTLQGAPGAPPPKPSATPPGQAPANMVPPK